MKLNTQARSLVRLCIISLIACFFAGCQTWNYTAQHRGVYTIAYNPTNLPIENIDLDTLRAMAKTSFGPDEQPAIVLVGHNNERELKLLDRDTGKVFPARPFAFDTLSSIAIKPLVIRQTGNYQISFQAWFEPRETFDFSVTRTLAQLAGTNKSEPFEWIHLSLKSKSASRNYGAVFSAAVQQRWYDLLNSMDVPRPKGVVILDFHMTEQGQFTGMRVVKRTVSDQWSALCEKAILNLAPYRPWPEEMRRKLSKNDWHVDFTFHFD